MPSRPPFPSPFRSLARSLPGHPVDFSECSDNELLALIMGNGAAALLYHRIAEGKVQGIGEEIEQKLKQAAQGQAVQDLVLNHDTSQLLQFMGEAGLRCLLLKGTPLSQLLFPQTYLRERCDTDLYVPHNDLNRVEIVVRKSGLRVQGLANTSQTSKQFQAGIVTAMGHRSTFDIHYSLSNRVLFRNTLPFEECWSERQPVPALGPNAWALSNRDLLLHACIHRIAHGRGTERNRLIWLYDIHLLWTAMDEAEQKSFIEKALDKKIGAVCADALQVCDELFETVGGASAATPEEATQRSPLTRLLQNHEDEPTAPLVNAGKLRWAWADLKATPGLRAKLQFARELLQNQL